MKKIIFKKKTSFASLLKKVIFYSFLLFFHLTIIFSYYLLIWFFMNLPSFAIPNFYYLYIFLLFETLIYALQVAYRETGSIFSRSLYLLLVLIQIFLIPFFLIFAI